MGFIMEKKPDLPRLGFSTGRGARFASDGVSLGMLKALRGVLLGVGAPSATEPERISPPHALGR